MFKVSNYLYLVLIIFRAKCQTTIESSENEISAETPLENESASTSFEPTENTVPNEGVTEELTTVRESPDSTSTTDYLTTTEENVSPATDFNSTQEETEATSTTESSSDTATITVSPTNPPIITVSFPTDSPPANESSDNLCKENEVYTCLPLCHRTCNNPLSKLICIPFPSYIPLCLRGCTCKSGYLLERTTRKCVKECPVKQPLTGY